MTELLLIFCGGALGSAHCVGMCGSFALAVGAGAPGWAANLNRQLTYSAGRLFTYSAAGAMAGFAGARLAAGLAGWIDAQAVLALVAGVLLMAQGLSAAGVVRFDHWLPQPVVCLAGTFFGPLLRGSGLSTAFLAGMFTGLLPCGLVYAYLALAGSTGELSGGMLRMALFGLGTVPVMVLVGLGASAVGLAWRRRMLRFAAWCVVLTGLISCGRGLYPLVTAAEEPVAACPFCTEG